MKVYQVETSKCWYDGSDVVGLYKTFKGAEEAMLDHSAMRFISSTWSVDDDGTTFVYTNEDCKDHHEKMKGDPDYNVWEGSLFNLRYTISKRKVK
tara:strand:- start:208 stop:492 length:285 start_codon:yes stop_codon:yes gene_type:complete